MHGKIVVLTIFVLLIPYAQSTLASEPSVTPSLCKPGVIEGMPLHIKNICSALKNSNRLSSALRQYIRNEAPGALYFMKFRNICYNENCLTLNTNMNFLPL